MILLTLDLPAWNNAGGLIVLPGLLLLIATAAAHLNPKRHNEQGEDQ